MRRSSFSLVLMGLALFFTPLQAQIVLDTVMSTEEQQRTGVANLSRNQKLALEAWLNKNFVEKEKTAASQTELSLSININNGQKLQLSDNSLWEIAPTDVQTSSVWITPFPVKITPSGNPDYPCLIIDLNSGDSVKARLITPSTQVPSPPP